MVQWCWVNFQCRGVLLIWIIVGQGPTALVIGAGGGCLDIFLSSVIFHFYLPLSGRRPDSLYLSLLSPGIVRWGDSAGSF